MSYLNYKVCNNYNDYLKLCKSTYENPFEMEDWDEFFKAHLKFNSTTGEYKESINDYKGTLGYSPDRLEYPLLVVYSFGSMINRGGKVTMQTWDWISLNELGINQNRKEVI